MALSFAEASYVVAFVAGIAPEKGDTFQSRLKQWQKMGFPEGTRVGKGKRAEYGAAQVLQLVLLVRLLRVGLTPERAQAVIRAGWDRFKGGFIEAITCQANAEPHLHYFMVLLDALSDLTAPGEMDHQHIFVDVFTDEEMVWAWDEPGADWSKDDLTQHAYSRFVTRNRMANAITIEIDSLVMFVWGALQALGKGPDIFAAEFADWLHEARTQQKRFLSRAGPTQEQKHFDEHLQSQSLAGRVGKMDHVALARAALSGASEDDLNPKA